jgi:flagellar biosynthesis/type III secretory pathway protein FliH
VVKGPPARSPQAVAGTDERPDVVADQRAQAILDDARAEAAALLEAARAEALRMVEQAAEAGKHEGFAQAEHLREQIAGLEQRMVKEIEGEVVRAALRVAEELLHAELRERPEAVVDIVASALHVARDARDVFLRVNPQDAKVLRAQKSRLIDALGRARDVDVREDRNVRPGGVLIQTESGVVDAQLETQLEEITRVLGA